MYIYAYFIISWSFFSLDYVHEIYETFLEENQHEDSLASAAKQLQEMTPSPMNSMLEKESQETALRKKQKRQSVTVQNVPPTTPCE